ncbi:hypothetical protein [Nonomuraea typhae]|uniref:Uncharacterized protein n=1 Tax=Nonomuraea typhae TaxID=2603600 RepID=A0ABW7Z198_9ACTN
MQYRFPIVAAAVVAAILALAGNASAAQSANAAAAGRKTLAVYEKTGGFAGVVDTVVVDDSGTAHVISRTSLDIQLTSTELRSLQAGLNRIRTWWPSTTGCNVPDHFRHSLSYQGRYASRCHTVPSDWQSAVDRFEALLNRAGAHAQQ